MENTTINGYTLKYKLGEGGMAVVWYAQNALHKPAAVKVLQKRFCDVPEIVSRFENEARLMVQLNHRNIRNIYDYSRVNDCPCMIMEYLEGKDLSQRMKEGERFSSEQLTTWWNQLVDALQYTHRKNIVHRDIKPSNLFLTEDGQIKILDFGVAKIRDNVTLTQTGSRMGTLMYMSPEQVYDVKNLNYKTDAYSLAVTFYHLLTGTPPYDTNTISDFEVQEHIVRKQLDLSVLPEPWRSFLPIFLNKTPDVRGELRKIETESFAATADETVAYTPLQTVEIKPQQTNYIPPQQPVYYQTKRSNSRPYILLSFVFIAALAYFLSNKNMLDTLWQKVFGNAQKPQTETVKKDASPQVTKPVEQPPVIVDSVFDEMPDTAAITETPPTQVITSVDLNERERNIKNLVAGYYKSRTDCSGLSTFFYPVIKQYLSKTNFKIEDAVKDCENYHRKWQFIEADINNNSFVFTHQQDGNAIVDYSVFYKIKQKEEDAWIPYNIDVSMVVDKENKITRIVERRIEKL